MGRYNGQLVASYEAHCPECDRAALGLGSTQRRATDELLKMNWRRKFGRWFCSEECVELWRQETVRLATEPPAQPDPVRVPLRSTLAQEASEEAEIKDGKL